MTDLGTLIMVTANSGIFAYIGFSLKERETNKEEFRLPYLRLFFIGMSVLNAFLGGFIALISANAGSLVSVLEAYLWYVGFVFLIYLIGTLEAVVFARRRWKSIDKDK